MGSLLSTKKNSTIPRLNVTVQMNYIVTNWYRSTELGLQHCDCPVDIVNIIIDKFTYQPIFDMEHEHKLKHFMHQNVSKSDKSFTSKTTQHTNNSMKTIEYDELFKIVIVGSPSVGKRSLKLRYAYDKFYDHYTCTGGIDSTIKTIQIDGKRIKLQIWDPAGQERFRNVTSSFYQGADGAIIVYDVTDIPSCYQGVKYWNEEINKHSECMTMSMVRKVLVGNKLDLVTKKEVSFVEGQILANKLGIFDFIETSARTGENVDTVLLLIVRQILNGRIREKQPFAN